MHIRNWDITAFPLEHSSKSWWEAKNEMGWLKAINIHQSNDRSYGAVGKGQTENKDQNEHFLQWNSM